MQAPHISYDSYNQKQNINFKQTINSFLHNKKYNNYEYYSYSNNSYNQSKYIIGYCLLENYYGIGPNAVSYIKMQNEVIVIVNNNHINNPTQKISTLSTNEILMQTLVQGLLLKKGIPITKNNNILQQPLISKLIKNRLFSLYVLFLNFIT